MSLRRTVGTILPLVLAVCGCGGGVDDVDPDLVPAKGKVTIDGDALSTGTIAFVSTEASKAAVSGVIDGGSFTLKTSASGEGIKPGTYKVTVVAKDGVDTMDAEGNPVSAKNLVPDKYGSAETSGLTAEVPEGGKTDFEFELESE